MLVTATALALLAGLLLGPVPRYLLRAGWVVAEPRATLVLWQSVGLAAGLAVLGALTSVALEPLPGGLLGALPRLVSRLAAGEPTGGLGLLHATLLLTTIALGIRLVVLLALAAARTRRARRRHRELIDLIGRPLSAGSLVLDHPAAAAYCLPGGAPRVVLTSGAVAMLDREELAAVLAHERAHLAERHDLVVLPFAAWSVALRWLPTVRRSRGAVDALVEMVADDRACTHCDRTALACALARFGSSGAAAAPAGALAAAGPAGATLQRVHRLLDPPVRSARLRWTLYAAAAALLALPTLALLAAAG
jgi:Zn-dependent protease with chaperone function